MTRLRPGDLVHSRGLTVPMTIWVFSHYTTGALPTTLVRHDGLTWSLSMKQLVVVRLVSFAGLVYP